MTTQVDRRRLISEVLAPLGVIASLVFVGMELRAPNIQSRAAAYQAMGEATPEGIGASTTV